MDSDSDSVPESSSNTTTQSSKKGGRLILTKRQRAKLNEEYQHDLLELPMEPTRKKHLTEEEIALRKSETARRRKHQSIQRAEQDKMDTINRLLKKQNTKRRSKEQEDTDLNQENQKDGGVRKSLVTNTFHYVNNREGSTLSAPIGVSIPIPFDQGPNYPPPIPLCSQPGCKNLKKYRSVKNYKYACSMEHLKRIEGRS
ncbi:5220_t:CDS:2 [Ambispora gerdemannii]|uniref:5220_t:CDS:1 n=1 Tax=Ambispora gerdemannii TaxID=144530 RepID=A0A9N8Z2L8_9GLOM|nr:5220_t:CDS:2 [Ambispora gerdemannii]